MAQFGPNMTNIQAPRSTTTVQEGVASDSLGIAAANQILGIGAGVVESLRAGNDDKILTQFQNEILSINQAVDQGAPGWNSTYARSVVRQKLMEFSANNPRLRKDLAGIVSDMMGTSGLGSSVVDGNREEIRREKLYDSLVANGHVSSDASPHEFEVAANNFMRAQEAERWFEEANRDLNYRKNVLGLDQAEYDAEKRHNTNKFVSEYVPHYADTIDSQFNTILNDPALTADQRVQAIESLWINLSDQVEPFFADMDSTQGAAIRRIFEGRKDLAIRMATGEISQEAMENELKSRETAIKLELWREPDIAKAIVLGGVFDFNLLPRNLRLEVTNLLARQTVSNADPNGNPANLIVNKNDGNGVAATKQYLEMVGKSDDESVPVHIQNILKGVEYSEGSIRANPADVNTLVQWFASPDFHNLTQTHSGAIGDMNAARDIISSYYGVEVLQLVGREWEANNISHRLFDTPDGPQVEWLDEDVSASAVIDFIIQNGSIRFTAIDTNDVSARSQANQLNKTLAPALNTLARATAHLNNENDYQSILEGMVGGVLEQGAPTREDDNVDLTYGDLLVEPTPASFNGEVRGGAGWTEIVQEDGTTIRREGTRAWRNNNPGNIEYGNFARNNGAIGSDGRFAVFPTLEDGRRAKYNLLFNSSGYRGMNIQQAINRYAPPSENDSAWYARSIANEIGVDVNTPLAQLTESQRQRILDAMQRVEGFREGTETIR